MKKTLLISFVIILVLLSACQGAPESEKPDTASQDKSPADIADKSAAEVINSASEQPQAENYDFLKENLTRLLTTYLLDDATLSVLTEHGITVSAEEIVPAGRTFSFTLVLSNRDGVERRYQMNGNCAYSSNFSRDDPWIIGIDWGGISVISPSTLAVCSLTDVDLVNLANLSDFGLSLNINELSGGKPVGVRYNQILGYVVLMNGESKDYFGFFDETGQLTRTADAPFPNNQNRSPLIDRISDSLPRISMFCENLTILETQPAIILTQGQRGENVLYNTGTNESMTVSSFMREYDGGHQISLYSNIHSSFRMIFGEKHLAVYQTPDNADRYFAFDENINLLAWPDRYYYDESLYPEILSWSHDNAVIKIACKPNGSELTLDFNKKTAVSNYVITPEDLNDEILSSSPDGRYNLRTSHLIPGGDAGTVNYVLQDTKTNSLYFVETVVIGFWAHHTNSGFFNDNELYVQTPEGLQTFLITPDGPVPSRPFLLPLGEFKDENYRRHLFSVLRSPGSDAYIALYTEEPLRSPFGDDFSRRSYCYKIGFCDKDGNLLESFDTTTRVFSCPENYGLLDNPQMSLSGDKLTLINESGKIIGVFDIKTHIYTDMSE